MEQPKETNSYLYVERYKGRLHFSLDINNCIKL